MALRKIKLADLIEQCEDKNIDLKYALNDVKGISTQKYFIDTKANMEGVPLKGYKIVYPNCFAYVPDTSRRGDRISLAYNNTNNPILVSSISIVFKVKSNELSSMYLFMYFNRPEFDRYSRYNSWGSAREVFSWEELCDINIDLPDISIQNKYVAIYEGLLSNLHSYKKNLDDLKLVCDGYIEKLRRNIQPKQIGEYIICTDKTTNDPTLKIKGISSQKKLTDSNSRVDGVDSSKYLQIDPNEFCYSPIHINNGSIALNNSNESFLLSPIYKTFKIIKENEMLSEYLMMWYSRKEFTRYCWFHAFGSARDALEWKQLCSYKIPVPNITIQNSIVNIYKCIVERKKISEVLNEYTSNICPILIKGSIEEGEKNV